MVIKNIIKEILRPSPRKFARSIIGNQSFIAFDVGAANGLIPHWQPLDGFAILYSFEPHPQSAEKLKLKYEKSDFKDMYHIMPFGLSRYGGPVTLYMLNAPTGSSILPIDLESPLVHKGNPYIFPINEIKINTERLSDVLKNYKISHCDIIKLDVQGSELEIVLGFEENNLKNLLSIEMEVGFHSIYKGAPKPHQVESALEPYGFELADLNIVKQVASKNGNANYYSDMLNQSTEFGLINGKLAECDMLFLKKPELILSNRDPSILKRYVAALCLYSLYTHALQIVDEAYDINLLSVDDRDSMLLNIRRWSSNNRPIWKHKAFDSIYRLFSNIKSHLGHNAWHRQFS